MSTLSTNVTPYTYPAYASPAQPFSPPDNPISQPYAAPPSDYRPSGQNSPQKSVQAEYAQLTRRWFPKQPFNTKAAPEDQIAGAGKFALMAGMLAICIPPLFLACIPLGVVTYIWQSQRNEDALNKMYKQHKPEDAPSRSYY